MQKNLFSLFAALMIACFSYAQNLPAFQPSHEEMMKRYVRASIIDSLTKNAVFKTSVTANWFADGKNFWYRNLLKDSVQEYIYVNVAKATKQALFNRSALASGLTGIGLKVDSLRPSLTAIEFDPKKQLLEFTVQNQRIACDLPNYQCRLTEKQTTPPSSPGRNFSSFGAFPGGATSPDKQWIASLENGNLVVKSATGDNTIQFTKDGNAEKPYGSIRWSPDSKYLVGYHINTAKNDPVYYILTSVANTTRGQLKSQPYKQPGDPWSVYTPFIFTLEDKMAHKINAEPIDFLNPPVPHWNQKDPNVFVYEKTERGHQRFRVIEVNATTANTKEIVDEKTSTFIFDQQNYRSYLKDSYRVIRSSEKGGWRHLYLVDLTTGTEKQITKGEWVVRGVDSIDEKKKEIWFRASGINAGEDPYHIHYYRINFDGDKMVALTPAQGNHTISFSPDKTYFTDTWSQVNVPPKTILVRSADKKEVMLLEEADLTLYKKSGVKPPEVFVAKGRDGKTDIWGIVSRPSDFDSTKKYPVLENIYAGPHDSFVPKNFTPYSEMQSLAELGFIVVMIDGMGTFNRSKAFHDVCWQNIADAGFPDRILWIKALAKKYEYVNADKVGLYGTSAGGQNTLGGLLFHPEFYKAGVSACGCHDNRVDKQWWNEQWMGYPVAKHYDDQSNVTNAAKLQGNLMLIVGEADTNVPPESTYRVVDALIKAEKNFDFLSIPGMGHSDGGPYGRIKKRDFFVKHLLGIEPPSRNSGELKKYASTGRERWSFE